MTKVDGIGVTLKLERSLHGQVPVIKYSSQGGEKLIEQSCSHENLNKEINTDFSLKPKLMSIS